LSTEEFKEFVSFTVSAVAIGETPIGLMGELTVAVPAKWYFLILNCLLAFFSILAVLLSADSTALGRLLENLLAGSVSRPIGMRSSGLKLTVGSTYIHSLVFLSDLRASSSDKFRECFGFLAFGGERGLRTEKLGLSILYITTFFFDILNFGCFRFIF